MEFGILFTSHPHHAREPYPHRDVHARVTAEIQAADALGYDTAWVAEHHFSNQYGIMPDVFTYMGYLAAKTSRIRLGTAVVTVPLYEPVRVVENMAFVDILSGGRVMIGLGSGYRPYEFAGFGREFEDRHDTQEEAIELILELLHTRRVTHQGMYFRSTIEVDTLNYDTLAGTPLVHGSPETVIAKLHTLRATTGLTSLLLHYPPYYGHEKTRQSLRLFAERVMPEFRPPTRREAVA
jgi:alkanesulfonate monooxygenase SsuD/methylene tetrahydromethanopterin reductase-like flavin-dependent oxidoreductase (luciferase family)